MFIDTSHDRFRVLAAYAAVALTLVAVLATASTAAASITEAPSAAAAQAAADGAVCDLFITNVDPGPGSTAVTARNLNEGGNGDEIFGKVGPSGSLPALLFPSNGTVQFPSAGTGRSAADFDSPHIRFLDGVVNWRLVEDDPFINDIIDNKFFPCQNGAGHVTYQGASATYDVEMIIQLVPAPGPQ